MLRICKKKVKDEEEKLSLIPVKTQEAPCKIIKFVGKNTELDSDIEWLDGDYWLDTILETPSLMRYSSTYNKFLEEAPKQGYLYFFKQEKELYTWDQGEENFVLIYKENSEDDSMIEDVITQRLDSYFNAIPFDSIISGEDIELADEDTFAPIGVTGPVVYSQQHKKFFLDDDGYYYSKWDASNADYTSATYGRVRWVYTAEKMYLITPNGLIG